MQGRAVAIYSAVFLLIAAGAFAFVTVAEAPEPSLDRPEVAVAEGDEFTVDGRTYTVSGFDVAQGQPTATLTWVDNDSRTFDSLDHAEGPDGTTVVHDGTEYWVRIPQVEEPGSFTLLEVPSADGVSVEATEQGDWLVNESGNFTRLEEYEGLERLQVETGQEFDVTEGEGEEATTRAYRVEEIAMESVSVSYNEPSEEEAIVRQTEVVQLGPDQVNHTGHFPNENTVQLTSDQEKIDTYLATHEDRQLFEQRVDGLLVSIVLALLAAVLLIGLGFLPRKE